jgi:hypothetical protein
MTSRNAPRLATWLLDKLGYTRHSAALTGDLLEEFHSGKSRAWYWRQAAIVIAKGIRRNAFLGRNLLAVAALFATRVFPEYTSWKLHRPTASISVLAEAVVILAMFHIPLRRATKGIYDAAAICGLIGWLSMWGFDAWASFSPVSIRLCEDLGMAAWMWVWISLPAPIKTEKAVQ